MIIFLCGVLAVWAAGFVMGEAMDWLTTTWYSPSSSTWMMIVFPVIAAWLIAEAVQGVTPRRMFDRRVSGAGTRFAVGASAGLIGLVTTCVVLPVADQAAPDWLVLASASAMATVLVLTFRARVRRGHCVRCGYDMKMLPVLDRCPECGRTGVL